MELQLPTKKNTLDHVSFRRSAMLQTHCGLAILFVLVVVVVVVYGLKMFCMLLLVGGKEEEEEGDAEGNNV